MSEQLSKDPHLDTVPDESELDVVDLRAARAIHSWRANQPGNDVGTERELVEHYTWRIEHHESLRDED